MRQPYWESDSSTDREATDLVLTYSWRPTQSLACFHEFWSRLCLKAVENPLELDRQMKINSLSPPAWSDCLDVGVFLNLFSFAWFGQRSLYPTSSSLCGAGWCGHPVSGGRGNTLSLALGGLQGRRKLPASFKTTTPGHDSQKMWWK